jgi:2',3'-cyclic-nucleotide 2'-phosphodiesterase (5'-nucleotidase family)
MEIRAGGNSLYVEVLFTQRCEDHCRGFERIMTVATLPMPALMTGITGVRPNLPGLKQPADLLPQLSEMNGRISDQFIRQAATLAAAAIPAMKPPLEGSPVYLPPIPPASKLPGYASLRIVSNNDPHEKFKALPHLVSAFSILSQQGRQGGWDVLRLNSGDNNVGKEPHEWALNIRLMNMIGYHAVTAGNHEFDVGSEHYAKALEYATFPTLVSNLRIPPGSAMDQMVRNGKIRIGPQIVQDNHGVYGLIGVTTPELKQVVNSKAKMQGETVQSFPETVANVKAQVEWLESQGINKVILLSHMGTDLDRKLAQMVPGIDVIIGGHSHDVIEGITPGYNYLQTPRGEPVLVLQAGKNAQYIGVADLLFDPLGRVIPQQNRLFDTAAFPINPQATVMKNSVLGTPQKIADITTAYDCNDNQYHADPVAQFTADAIRAHTDADIAFVRSSEIRSNIEPGALTDQDIEALMPFKDPIVKVNYSGEEILKSLSKSAEGVAKREAHPGMLHPSGMAVSMNKQTGQVQQAYVLNKNTRQWETLNPQKIYSVALGEFSVSNKEFPDFSHPERLQQNTGLPPMPLQTYFAMGLQRAGAPFKPIQFRDDGRLQII